MLLFCGGLKLYPTCPQGLQGFPGLPYAVYESGLQSAVGLEEIRLGKKNKEGRRKLWLPAKKTRARTSVFHLDECLLSIMRERNKITITATLKTRLTQQNADQLHKHTKETHLL